MERPAGSEISVIALELFRTAVELAKLRKVNSVCNGPSTSRGASSKRFPLEMMCQPRADSVSVVFCAVPLSLEVTLDDQSSEWGFFDELPAGLGGLRRFGLWLQAGVGG